jgi:hypothetical protein
LEFKKRELSANLKLNEVLIRLKMSNRVRSAGPVEGDSNPRQVVTEKTARSYLNFWGLLVELSGIEPPTS